MKIEVASPAITRQSVSFFGKAPRLQTKREKGHLIACYKSREFIDREGILGILRGNFKKYCGEVRLLTFLRGSLWTLTH